eukprot:5293703-Prymnesium_polylepis.2
MRARNAALSATVLPRSRDLSGVRRALCCEATTMALTSRAVPVAKSSKKNSAYSASMLHLCS